MNDEKKLRKLLDEGWEENGVVQCSIHGGDHDSIMYCPPKNIKAVCRAYCPVEKIFTD